MIPFVMQGMRTAIVAMRFNQVVILTVTEPYRATAYFLYAKLVAPLVEGVVRHIGVTGHHAA